MPDAVVEWIAVATIAAAVGSTAVTLRDSPGAPARTHDFDVETTDRRVIALEVTTAAVGPLVGMQNEVEQEPSWAAPSLNSSWHLRIRWTPPTPIKKLRAEAERHLAVLEKAGFDGFGDRLPADDPRGVHVAEHSAATEALEALRKRGVVRCGPAPERDRQGQPVIAITGLAGRPGGFTSGINPAVEAAAAANQIKLEQAIADEKHLFVWVDVTAHAAGMGTGVGGTPPLMPVNLPTGVDVAWLAFPNGPGVVTGISTLWRARRGQSWESHPLTRQRTTRAAEVRAASNPRR